MEDPRSSYPDLLEKCLTDFIYGDVVERPDFGPGAFDPTPRAEGRDWPARAHTTVGLKRLDNPQVLRRGSHRAGRVPGDLIETGVYWQKSSAR